MLLDLALRFIVPAAGEDARAMSLGLPDAGVVLSDTSIDGASIRVTVGVNVIGDAIGSVISR